MFGAMTRGWAVAVLTAVAVCCTFSAARAADLIVFKSGKTVECVVVNETEGRVVYLVKGRERVAARSAIAKIERTQAKTVDVNGRLNGKPSKRETSGTRVEEMNGERGGPGREDGKCPYGERYKDGYAPGLVAHYYKDPDHWNGLWQQGAAPQAEAKEWTFTKYAYTTIEPQVNHIFIRRGWFTVRWVGTLIVGNPAKPDGGGRDDGIDPEIRFEFHADDGARLLIDGKKIIDDWVPRSEETPESHRFAALMLRPGRHKVVIEYFQGESLEHHDNDPAKLYWSSKELNIPRRPISASRFMHTKADLQPRPGRVDGDEVKLNFVHSGKAEQNKKGDGDAADGDSRKKKEAETK